MLFQSSQENLVGVKSIVARCRCSFRLQFVLDFLYTYCNFKGQWRKSDIMVNRNQFDVQIETFLKVRKETRGVVYIYAIHPKKTNPGNTYYAWLGTPHATPHDTRTYPLPEIKHPFHFFSSFWRALGRYCGRLFRFSISVTCFRFV